MASVPTLPISLRDYFATTALGAFLSTGTEKVRPGDDNPFTPLAKRCYWVADAMLAARATQGDNDASD